MTKQVVPIHGPDHSLGGPDPFRPALPYVYGSNQAGGQTVTADAELHFTFARTNDKDTFGWDKAGDPDGLLVIRNGIYVCLAQVNYAAGSISVERSVYTTFNTVSGGPLAGLGTEFGQDHFALGTEQNQSSVGVVTATNTIPKSRLDHISLRSVIGVSQTDPYRFAVILQHPAGDYTLSSSLASTLTIIRVGELGDEPVIPPGLL